MSKEDYFHSLYGNWDNLENNKYIDKLQKESSPIWTQHNKKKKNQFETIIKKLNQIETEIKKLTGVQFINGVWR